MKDVLEYILKKIARDAKLSIEEKETDYSTEFVIDIEQEHIGKIIGKKGRTINALRNLLYLYRQTTHEDSPSSDYLNARKKITIEIADKDQDPNG